MQRAALDALRGLHNDADAIALYVLLVDQHGHRPSYRFCLYFETMREAGLTSLSVPRLRKARQTLEEAGLLALASKHRAGVAPQTYALTRPGQCVRPDSNLSVVTSLAAAAAAPEVKGGEG